MQAFPSEQVLSAARSELESSGVDAAEAAALVAAAEELWEVAEAAGWGMEDFSEALAMALAAAEGGG